MTATVAIIAGVALLAICCQADLTAVGGSSSSSRRLRGDATIRGGVDIDDTAITTTTDGTNDKPPKTFLIKFKDGLAQTRSLEIHRSSRSRRQQQQQQHRETRGEEGVTDEQEHAHGHEKWQSRAKSISSISDERHIAIVEMDSDSDNQDGDVIAGAGATSSSMYDELMADEDVELVEEVRVFLDPLVYSDQ